MKRNVQLGAAAVLTAALCSCAVAGGDPDDEPGGGQGIPTTAGVAGAPATSAGTTSSTVGGFDAAATTAGTTGLPAPGSGVDGGASTGGSTGGSTLATGGSTGFTGAAPANTSGGMTEGSDPLGEIVDTISCFISACDEADMEMETEMEDAGP